MTASADRISAAYQAQLARRRSYGTVLWAIFIALMVAGFGMADARNAGGFWQGLPAIADYPAQLIAEAWAKAANLPGHMWRALPALVETLNIAAASTLIGTLGGGIMALLATPGLAPWPRMVPVFRRLLDICRAIPELVIALVLIFVLGGGPVPAVIAIAFHTTGALGKLFSEVAENASLKPV